MIDTPPCRFPRKGKNSISKNYLEAPSGPGFLLALSGLRGFFACASPLIPSD